MGLGDFSGRGKTGFLRTLVTYYRCVSWEMAPASLVSLVNSEQSLEVKKRFYIPCQDEYSSSSGPLNGELSSCP